MLDEKNHEFLTKSNHIQSLVNIQITQLEETQPELSHSVWL